ncbi:MAG TPA: hypothetical protein VMD75_17275 [Candidatus Binataceae bacterium]|nr:hypothetical protein [Candidatus Binataceae bacterium]
MSHLLPEAFSELEFLVDTWCLRTERDRNNRRIGSEMTELETFYDAILPRLEEILNFLSRFELGNLPEDVERLFLLSLSMAEVAPAVEFYRSPTVPDTFGAERFEFEHKSVNGLYPVETHRPSRAPRKA